MEGVQKLERSFPILVGDVHRCDPKEHAIIMVVASNLVAEGESEL